MHSILVVGTDPPCARCGLLAGLMEELARRREEPFEVRHIDYESGEARKIAASLGLVPGTAKDVARAMGETIELPSNEEISERGRHMKLLETDPQLMYLEETIREVWVVDQLLRKYELAARDLGILMTPVLMIDNQVYHSGSVPPVEQLERWIREVAGQEPGPGNIRIRQRAYGLMEDPRSGDSL